MKQPAQQLAVPAWCDWLLSLAIILAIAVANNPARAQDGEEPDSEVEPLARPARRVIVHDRQLDQQIFQGESIESARARLNMILQGRVRWLDRQYRLTDAQKDKLILAGQGDIKRAFDAVDELRRKFELGKSERAGVIECFEEAQRIHSALEGGIFGPKSLLTKTIGTTITEDQKAYSDHLLTQYRSSQFGSAISAAVMQLDRLLNLTRDQYQRLKELLLSEVRPPWQWGESSYGYIMYQLSRVPEEKLRPIFRDTQWKFLHELLISWNDAGELLERDGFVLSQSPPARRETVAEPLVERRR